MHKKRVNPINADRTFLLGILGVVGVMNGVIGDGRERDSAVLLLLLPLPTYTSNSVPPTTFQTKHCKEHSTVPGVKSRIR